MKGHNLMAEAREIVEAAARAKFSFVCKRIGISEEEASYASGDDWHQYLPECIAALLAALDKMQAPNEAMIEAAAKAIAPGVCWLPNCNCSDESKEIARQDAKATIHASWAELRREIAALGEEGRGLCWGDTNSQKANVCD